MNDLPQNELLSAYLDGELTADEQAEAERLLASSPAARQLLDELRALSATLQSLPQQKLGEDLSRQVLRVAERRMLTEGEPDDAAPVPLSRTVLRRFINRRSMVWLGLTAAVAVMIVVHEQQQKNLLPNKADKTVALVRGGREKTGAKTADEFFRPTTIQAAPGTVTENAVEAEKLTAAKKLGGERPASENLAMMPQEKEGLERHRDSGYSPSPPPVEMRELHASVAPANAAPQLSTPPPPLQDPIGKTAAVTGKAGAYGSKGGPDHSVNWYDGDGAASIGPDVLLVFCDVSPEATKKKAFDKVLTENGIVSRRRVELMDQSRQLDEKANYAGNAPAAGGATLWQHPPAAGVVRRQAVAAGAELVYVEATPDQIKATLARLAAQPKVFVSVSIKSPQDKAARQVVRYLAMSDEQTQALNKPSGACDKSNGDAQHQKERDLGHAAPAKPATDSPANRRADTASKNGEAKKLGGCRDEKAVAAGEPDHAKSEEKASEGDGGVNAAQTPSGEPSLAREVRRARRRPIQCGLPSTKRHRKPTPQPSRLRRPTKGLRFGRRSVVGRGHRSRPRDRRRGSACYLCCGWATVLPWPRKPKSRPASTRSNLPRQPPPPPRRRSRRSHQNKLYKFL